MAHVHTSRQLWFWGLCLVALATSLSLGVGSPLRGQDDQATAPQEGGPSAVAAEQETGEEVAGGDPQQDPSAEPVAAQTAAGGRRASEGLNLFWLFWESRWFMLPIGLMSLMVVAVSIERFIGMRRSRVLPQSLITRLGQLGGARGFDPREAYRICQQYPSAASSVIRAMLLKVGRPHSEVEHAVAEASDREAQRMYSNVRWLNLAAAVTPLMGLLGTVWGMMYAFHETTKMLPGQNKADQLAEGIYLALVTTLSGLVVAIPAAILAHYFEGRVQALFHEVDEMLFNLMPQIERFEGRVRFGHDVPERRGEVVGRDAPARTAVGEGAAAPSAK